MRTKINTCRHMFDDESDINHNEAMPESEIEQIIFVDEYLNKPKETKLAAETLEF